MFEEIAARIPTDSLARLYLGALDAPKDKAWIYQEGIACQVRRMAKQYGGVASSKAMRHLEDSLFTTADARKRWVEAQLRFPSIVSPNYRCDLRDLTRAPDSLDLFPTRTAQP